MSLVKLRPGRVLSYSFLKLVEFFAFKIVRMMCSPIKYHTVVVRDFLLSPARQRLVSIINS